MTGTELRELRGRLGLSVLEFGNAIGIGGKSTTKRRTVRRLEARDLVPDRYAKRAVVAAIRKIRSTQ